MKSKKTPPSIDFEKVKELILTSDTQSLGLMFKLEKREEEAMFLFWALDFLQQRQEKIPEDQLNQFNENKKFLLKHQRIIMNQKLEKSLIEYSSGFVLGTLEVAIRDREARIVKFQEYQQLVQKLERWPEIGFQDEKFKKQWEQRMNSVKEIEIWMHDRTESYFPILSAIILSGKYQKTPRIILKALRKGGRSDNTVFQILAGILHSNPILNKRISDLCQNEKIEMSSVRKKLVNTLELLSSDTSEMKIKKYCQLLLPAINQGK